jgi:hypothetical protein
MSIHHPAGARRRWPTAALAVAIGAIAFAGYLRTMRPSFGWGDSSELITAAYFLGIGHSPGYPTWMLLAYPVAHLPLGASVALRLNVMNALFGAVAVGLFFLAFRQMGGGWGRTEVRPADASAEVPAEASAEPAVAAVGAAVGALTLAFAATLWDVTTEADVFTLHACFTALILLAVLRWRRERSDRALFLVAALVGLSLTNHPLTSLLIPALLAFVWLEQGRRYFTLRRLALAACFLLLGLLVYAYLPIRGAADPPPRINDPHSLVEVWQQLTAPGARRTMFDKPLPVALHRAALYAWRLHVEFGWLGFVLGIVGVARLFRRDRRLLAFLGLAAVTDVAYASNFSVIDAYMYFLPLQLMGAAFVAVGAGAALGWGGRLAERAARAPLLPGRRYATAAAVLFIAPALAFSGNLPSIDGHGDRDAERFARAVLEELPPNAALLGDWMMIAPVGYLQYVEGRRRDVQAFPAAAFVDDSQFLEYVTPDFMDRFPAVYLTEEVSDHTSVLREAGCFPVPEGPVMRIYRRRPDPRTVLADAAGDPIARFGDGLGLVRVEVPDGPARPWQSFDVTLYWTLLPGAPPEHYEVILSLRQGAAVSIWMESVPLAQDLYPVEAWRPGQVLRERHRIFLREVAAPGEYELVVRVRRRDQASHRPTRVPCSFPTASAATGDYLLGRVQVSGALSSPGSGG